jgi:hypothetical protein
LCCWRIIDGGIVAATKNQVDRLNRGGVRASVERRFTARCMAQGDCSVYHSLNSNVR